MAVGPGPHRHRRAVPHGRPPRRRGRRRRRWRSTSRSRPAPRAYGLRRGTMKAGHEIDLGPEPHGAVRHLQRHVHPRRARRTRSTTGGASATTRGASATTPAARCGCGSPSSSPRAWSRVWHWEYPNGAPRLHRRLLRAGRRQRARSPVIDFQHDLHWIDGDGQRRSTTAATATTSPASPATSTHARGRPHPRHRRRGPLGPALRPARRRPQRGGRAHRRRHGRAPPSTSSPAPTTTATSRSPAPNASRPTADPLRFCLLQMALRPPSDADRSRSIRATNGLSTTPRGGLPVGARTEISS